MSADGVADHFVLCVGKSVNDVEWFEFDENRWTLSEPMLTRRSRVGTVVMKGKVAVIYIIYDDITPIGFCFFKFLIFIAFNVFFLLCFLSSKLMTFSNCLHHLQMFTHYV